MNSPITGKPMQLVKEPESKLSFRKEEFEIVYHYYLCKESGEQFTTDELDRINQTQVHNKYREKYGIPFPDEIREIREKYQISASKMSEILGLGTNSYRLYETGEIPSVANGRLILAVKKPEDFIRQVKASKHLLSEKDIVSIIDKARDLVEQQKANMWDVLFEKRIFRNEMPSEYSGYKKPSFEKIANIIRFFSDKVESCRTKELYKTKLNKLLFYSDFGNFKRTGFSITGITYRAIQMGPVPAEYHKLYDKLNDDELIELNYVLFDDGNYGEAISGAIDFDETLFSEDEMATLTDVANKFSSVSTSKIVELSHEEAAWIDNQKDRELISYPRFAFLLKNID